MSILQSLKLFTTGVGLVSSTSPSSNHSPLINSYSPASRLKSRVGKNLENDYRDFRKEEVLGLFEGELDVMDTDLASYFRVG